MNFTQKSFCMTCPECDDDIEDIEATVYVGHRTEHFWGAPTIVDESECDIDYVPDCPTCKKQTISEDYAAEHYWDSVHE